MFHLIQQNIGEAAKAFVDQVYTDPTKLMILGPSFTSQAKVIAEMAPYYNLLDVSIFKPLAKHW